VTRVLIISPHNDDALIGCFLYLAGYRKLHKVGIKEAENYVYFGREELEGDRLTEAVKFAKDFNLTIVDDFDSDYDLVLAPSPESKHYYHRYFAWKSLDVKAGCRIFYSTDMEEWWVRPLPIPLRKLKKELLDRYFPQERDLWAYDGRYYMFEGYISLLEGEVLG